MILENIGMSTMLYSFSNLQPVAALTKGVTAVHWSLARHVNRDDLQSQQPY